MKLQQTNKRKNAKGLICKNNSKEYCVKRNITATVVNETYYHYYIGIIPRKLYSSRFRTSNPLNSLYYLLALLITAWYNAQKLLFVHPVKCFLCD